MATASLDIAKTLESLAMPEYYNLELTKEIVAGITDKEILKKIAKYCVEIKGKIYLPLRKHYSLNIKTEKIYSGNSPEQKAAVKELKALATEMAELMASEEYDIESQEWGASRNSWIKKIEDIIKAMCLRGASKDMLELELFDYYQDILVQIKILTGAEDKNLAIAHEIITTRVYDGEEKLIKGWTKKDTESMGSNFTEAIFRDFCINEENSWEDYKEELEESELEARKKTA